jgi:hypothetical protein
MLKLAAIRVLTLRALPNNLLGAVIIKLKINLIYKPNGIPDREWVVLLFIRELQPFIGVILPNIGPLACFALKISTLVKRVLNRLFIFNFWIIFKP